MKKVIICIVLVVTMLLSAVPCCAANRLFTDLDDTHWSYKYVEEAVPLGIISGFPDGSFQPERQVSYGELAKLIATSLYPKYEPRPAKEGEHWARQYVKLMTPLFFYEGQLSDADLDSIISRKNMVILVACYNCFLHAEERTYEINKEYVSKLKDFEELDSVTADAVNHCMQYGIIDGFEDGTFRQNEGFTRAQAAKAIYLARIV